MDLHSSSVKNSKVNGCYINHQTDFLKHITDLPIVFRT